MSLARCIALAHFGHIGPIGYRRLVEHFGSLDAAWCAPREALAQCLPERLAHAFVVWRKTVDVDALVDDVTRRRLAVVTIDDPAYPALLTTIHDPPFLLFFRGTLPTADALCLGVVGSRRATEYGLRAAADLSRALAAHVVIVSGLAWGVDEAAHHATLEAHGTTIAVLASGLDGGDSYRKRKLANAIVEGGGCVMSEFPPTMPPLNHHFPIRNRIIAGMSKGVLVVEAAERSGSLITARAALAENREVFAVPGPIFSETSAGTNRLCKEGAHVTTCAKDVLDAFGVLPRTEPTPATPPSDPTAVAVLAAIGHVPRHVDDIARATRLASATIMSALALLELEGHVRNLGGMRYIR